MITDGQRSGPCIGGVVGWRELGYGVYGYLRSRDPRAGSRAGHVEGPLWHPGGTVRQQALVVI